MSTLLAGRLAAGGTLFDGWLEVEGEQISRTGRGAPPRTAHERLGGVIAPGLCDLQVNGAGGQEVGADPAALDTIDGVQLAHGVTSYLPTIVSCDEQSAARAVTALEARTADPGSPVAGIHLEGPFLNPRRSGVHPAEYLRTPADGMPGYYTSPAVRLVTLAPELPGALELIADLRRRGVAVALGHSDASVEVARRAIDAGARLVTHVFNAMAPLHHRAPGPAGAALVDRRVQVGVIADGMHVDPLMLELVRRAAGTRVMLVSDASPGAAAPAGRYRMRSIELEAEPSGAVRTHDGRLAGTSLTLDAALRNWASMTRATLPQAIRAASEAPAAAVGLASGLRPGAPADLVLLDEAGVPRRVMRHGRWLG